MTLGTLETLRERLGGRKPDGKLVIGATYASELKNAALPNQKGTRYFNVDAVIKWLMAHPEFKLTNGRAPKQALQSGECYILTTIPFDCPLCGERVKGEHRCTAAPGAPIEPPIPRSKRGRPPRGTQATSGSGNAPTGGGKAEEQSA